jgi:hypothetical protein
LPIRPYPDYMWGPVSIIAIGIQVVIFGIEHQAPVIAGRI